MIANDKEKPDSLTEPDFSFIFDIWPVNFALIAN